MDSMVPAGTAMKFAVNAGPMPAPFAIVGQAYQVKHHAPKTVFSEHKCHRTPFALLTKRCGSSADDIWFSPLLSKLRMKNAKPR